MNVVAFMASMEFEQKYARLARERRSAKDAKETRCQRCGLCCWSQPGALTQDDLAKLAEHHGMTPRDFFASHCVVTERLGESVVRLARANEQDKLGRYLSDADSWNLGAPCGFLKEDGGSCRCALQDVKPAECRASKCWKPDSEALPIRWSDAELHALGWDGWTGEFAEKYEE